MLITVMLTAALAATPSAPPPAPDQGNGPTLTITGDCPGTKTFTVTQATPNDRVFLIIGRTSMVVIPPPDCAGLIIDVRGRVDVLQTNGQGTASINHDIPAGACDLLVGQAVDIATCRKSTLDVVHDHGDWDLDEAEYKRLRGPAPLGGTLTVTNLGASPVQVRTWKSGGQARVTRVAQGATAVIPLLPEEMAYVRDIAGDQVGTNGTWRFTVP